MRNLKQDNDDRVVAKTMFVKNIIDHPKEHTMKTVTTYDMLSSELNTILISALANNRPVSVTLRTPVRDGSSRFFTSCFVGTIVALKKNRVELDISIPNLKLDTPAHVISIDPSFIQSVDAG